MCPAGSGVPFPSSALATQSVWSCSCERQQLSNLESCLTWSHVHGMGGCAVPLTCNCRRQHCVEPHTVPAQIYVVARALTTLCHAID